MSANPSGSIASNGATLAGASFPVAAGIGLGASLLGGKNGKRGPIPGYSNGQYTLTGKPYEKANTQYQIAGDKGAYDLVPTIPVKTGNPSIMGHDQGFGNTAENIYKSMRGGLGDDASALAQFDARFPLKQQPPARVGSEIPKFALGPDGMFMGHGPANNYSTAFGMSPQTYKAIQGLAGKVTVNDVVGRPMGLLGGYAKNIKNPVFTPNKLANALTNTSSPTYQKAPIAYVAPQAALNAGKR